MLKINLEKYLNNPRFAILDKENFIIHDRIREVDGLLNREGNFYYSEKVEKAIQKINDMIELEVTNTKSWEHTLTKLVVLLENAPQEDDVYLMEKITDLERSSIKTFNSLDNVENLKEKREKKLNNHSAKILISSLLLVVLNVFYLDLISNFIKSNSILGISACLGILLSFISFLFESMVILSVEDKKSSYFKVSFTSDIIDFMLKSLSFAFALSLNPIFIFVNIFLLRKNTEFKDRELKKMLPISQSLLIDLPGDIYNLIVAISEYNLPKSYRKDLSQVIKIVLVDVPEQKPEITDELLFHLKATKKRLELIND